MRNRLVAAFVGLTVLVISLYAAVRAYNVADLVHDQEQQELEQTADQMVVLLTELERADRPVTTGLLERSLQEGDWMEYARPGASPLSTSAGESVDSDLEAVREIPGGGSLTVTRSGDVVSERTIDAVVPVLLIGLGLVLISVLAGALLARRLAQPFQRLAALAGQLGTDRELDVPRFSIPEADQIGVALHDAAVRLDQLVKHERDLAVTASHELRTPITALRLRLEDLALWPQTEHAVSVELQQCVAELDRLSSAVTALLDDARGQREETATDLDLAEVLASAARGAEAAGLQVVVDAAHGVRVRTQAPVLARLVGLLVEEVAARGPGVVTLGLADLGTHVRIVADHERDQSGAGPAPNRVIGELAAELGGHCETGSGGSLAFLLPATT
jgi:hypothetical protein